MDLPNILKPAYIVQTWQADSCPSLAEWIPILAARYPDHNIPEQDQRIKYWLQLELKKSGETMTSARQRQRAEVEGSIYPDYTTPSFAPVNLRAAVYDIETTDFDATNRRGFFVLGCILPLDSDDVITVSIQANEFGYDGRALRQFFAELSNFDILIGHNIRAFDANYLHSRIMAHGLSWPKTWIEFDTYQTAKTLAIKAASKGLAALCDYFGIESNKTSVYSHNWNKIRSPNAATFSEALSQIEDHCIKDVFANRDLFYALYPYALTLSANPFKVGKFRAGDPTLDRP